jgi:D-alanine--D-alanine ligase
MVESSPLAKRPFVLKPVDDGSSVGLLMARTVPVDSKDVDAVFAHNKKMLMEELVEGIEITVPILGERALPVIEIMPPQGEEFSYENKYNGATAELCPPQHVSAETQKLATEYARKLHKLAGVRHLSRTDMIVRPDGSLVILEINTMPGMTSNSLFPVGAKAAGMSFKDLVSELAELALAK